ncbi:hypothetical protein CES86_4347 [Brucella lupini]|uniref:Uncharacterized protein n=1 Tax=Brucella lupini TaxID=255457 RepID=A0A256GEH5_9HYPH|nr:hypothetical protein CES86_4347 [Brucella lupini]
MTEIRPATMGWARSLKRIDDVEARDGIILKNLLEIGHMACKSG